MLTDHEHYLRLNTILTSRRQEEKKRTQCETSADILAIEWALVIIARIEYQAQKVEWEAKKLINNIQSIRIPELC